MTFNNIEIHEFPHFPNHRSIFLTNAGMHGEGNFGVGLAKSDIKRIRFARTFSYDVVLCDTQIEHFSELFEKLGFEMVCETRNPNTSRKLQTWMKKAQVC